MTARGLAILAAAVWALSSQSVALAQGYPNKTVRVIVPFVPGGTPDVVGRLVAPSLSDQTGQSFVIDNRAGADGGLGVQFVADWPADGYTLLVTSSSFVINPSFRKKMPFNVIEDFAPVTNIVGTEAYILGVNPDLPVRSVADLIALTRAPDNKLSFGSPGVGNALHLAAELFKSLTKTHMVHVPYRGAAPALSGLIANDVQVMFMTPPASLPFIESGKIRALGYTGAKRFTRLPGVPTLAEAGVPGMEVLASWAGMFAPARTPASVLARLHQAVAKGLATPDVRDRVIALGLVPIGNSPAEFKPFVAARVELRSGEHTSE